VKRTPLTPEQLRIIKDSPLSESDGKVAKRLGVGPNVVGYHRSKQRKLLSVKGEPIPSAKVGEPGPIERAIDNEPDWVPEPLPTSPKSTDGHEDFHHSLESCATVTISVCTSAIDRWWSNLGIDQKAEIFAVNFDCCSLIGAKKAGGL
jgi:hypothetical protein